ncbi:hypothetical protein [Novosphingobium sp.]|uniref:DUF4139 domain-containing protein n=1 Tax=Novosphingobium sp. TaxID=1874826 RepID=UPI0025DFFA1A|nr:hypothetical protein [Novosphingobium sp.]MCC6924301.1 hypothetical protein [Novosphingobium sp.]
MRWLIAMLLSLIVALPAAARDVAASDPIDVSVTIYRAPWRNGGSIQLGSLGGFAVINETRRVTIPAGKHRLRFEGVVDGIIPASAIVAGLPGGVIEKNQDSALLSPAALLRAARGKVLSLKRTDPATGKPVLVSGEIISASDQGVMFKTAAGTEALRCSGLAETFRYDVNAEGLAARPTLSVLTSSARAVTAMVTLTYIAEGFDWSANYTAQLNPDGKTMELGGWITLANGNSVSLSNARTQIVAGGLNRAYVAKFVNQQPQAIARCWPQQRTHDVPRKPERPYELVQPWLGEDYETYADAVSEEKGFRGRNAGIPPPAMMVMAAPPPPPPPPAPPPPPEQLGDLKLYRVPQRTTVAAQQMKQTRLVEQSGVPYERIYTAMLYQAPWGGTANLNAIALIRTVNDKAHNLGLPLPAGSFLIGQQQFGRAMLVGEPSLSDTAEDEKIELLLGQAPDITVESKLISVSGKSALYQVTVKNAGAQAVPFELRLDLNGRKLVAPSIPAGTRNGRPLFEFELPGEGEMVIQYTARSD